LPLDLEFVIGLVSAVALPMLCRYYASPKNNVTKNVTLGSDVALLVWAARPRQAAHHPMKGICYERIEATHIAQT